MVPCSLWSSAVIFMLMATEGFIRREASASIRPCWGT
ncbi:hypothetical protein SGLAM104S_00065 [Streptomyces glaucescens]